MCLLVQSDTVVLFPFADFGINQQIAAVTAHGGSLCNSNTNSIIRLSIICIYNTAVSVRLLLDLLFWIRMVAGANTPTVVLSVMLTHRHGSARDTSRTTAGKIFMKI